MAAAPRSESGSPRLPARVAAPVDGFTRTTASLETAWPPPKMYALPIPRALPPRRGSSTGRRATSRSRAGFPSSTSSEDDPPTRPPAASTRPSGSATAARRDTGCGSEPMRRTRSAALSSASRLLVRHEVGRGKQVDPVRLVEEPAPRVRPRPCGRTATRSASSAGRSRSRGGCSHRSRRSGRSASARRATALPGGPARSRRRTTTSTAPRRFTITIFPGSVKLATSTCPSGSSCASDGYGDRRADRPEEVPRRPEPVDPAADLGDEQAAVRSGVSPFGLAKPRGGSWTQLPPSTRDDLRARSSWTIRQFRMSATVVIPDSQAIRVVGCVQVARARARNTAVTVGPDPALRLQRELDQRVVELLVGDHRAGSRA